MSARARPRLSVLSGAPAHVSEVANLCTDGGELGPLGAVYQLGGFGAVALAKLVAIGVALAILALHQRRTGHGRWLALLVATVGIFGALTNTLAIA